MTRSMIATWPSGPGVTAIEGVATAVDSDGVGDEDSGGAVDSGGSEGSEATVGTGTTVTEPPSDELAALMTTISDSVGDLMTDSAALGNGTSTADGSAMGAQSDSLLFGQTSLTGAKYRLPPP